MPTRHILVVDDDPDLTDLVRVLLKGEGHSISVASTGEHAEQIALKLETAAVGVTLEMDLDGYRLYRISGS